MMDVPTRPSVMFRHVRLPEGVAGGLRLHSMPGRHEPLDQVWQHIRRDAIQVIICLAGSQEIQTTSPSYAAAIEAKTLPCSIESFPITDFGVPRDREAFWSLASSIATQLKAGGRVLIHCGAGIGRTGTPAMSVLVALGEPTVNAEQAVSAAGSHPETDEQSALVAWCAARAKNVL